MKRSLSNYFLCLIITFCTVVIVSCKKDTQQTAPITNFATLGLYQRSYFENNITYKRLLITAKVGTTNLLYPLIFDTGSSGLTIDANGLIPANRITSGGIIVQGDSEVLNGITVTNQTATISFGGGSSGETREYGNLAYADVTIGDNSGNVTITQMPFFLYYKVVDMSTGTVYGSHAADVFGVGPGEGAAGKNIKSPLSYFKLPTGVTNGFRLGLLNTPFTSTPTNVPGLLTIGLTPNDLNSSGFIMHPLNFSSVSGYLPIPGTVTYGTKTVNGASLLFDTGNPAITYLADPTVNPNLVMLPAGTTVSVTTNKGFSYQYSTATNNTEVVNSIAYGDPRSIFSIDFFVNNYYLMDYQNNRIGLKNK